ncbi:MAG TPA: hypothetical protein VMN39_04970, partial [Longimicrobiaceae bacterium]|nr:hypothetical protein [Longimicrobiaceae bacterium]
GRVPTDEIQAWLGALPDLAKVDSEAVARRARGSTRRAIELARGGGAGGGEEHSKAGRELLLAAIADGPVARLAAANDRRPMGARNELVFELEALAEWLRDLLATTSGAEDQVSDPIHLPILKRIAAERGVDPTGIMRCLDRVDAARELALGNVNPQLIVATLLSELQRDLRPIAAGGVR